MPEGQKGFSLIEIIVSMVLLGILAAVASGGVVYLARGYVFTKDNNDALNRAQLAMSRLTKEFRGIQSVTSATATSIAYTTGRNTDPPSEVVAAVSWGGTAGDPLMYTFPGGSSVMIDHVQDFVLQYYNHYNDAGPASWSGNSRIIKIVLKVKAAENTDTQFTTRVTLQNLY